MATLPSLDVAARTTFEEIHDERPRGRIRSGVDQSGVAEKRRHRREDLRVCAEDLPVSPH
jgi:hypothetical protein